MNKISLIDEDSILMDRITDFLMEKEKYIVISKNSDVASFFKRPLNRLSLVNMKESPKNTKKAKPK